MTGPRLDRLAPHRHWAALLAVLSLVAAVRVHLLDVPLERDEGEYAYMAQLLLDGAAPFEGAHNMKLPGTAAAYALSMAVAGQTIEGARAGLLVANLATIVLVFLLGRVLLGAAGGLAAAAAYASLSLSPAFFGIFGHATHFVALFGTAGLLALARAGARGRASPRGRRGAARPRIPHEAARRRVPRGRRRLARLGPRARARAGGGAAARARGGRPPRGRRPPGRDLRRARRAGRGARALLVLGRDYGRAYGGVVPLSQAPRRLSAALARVVPPNAILWALAAAGTLAAAVRPAAVPGRGVLLAVLAFSALGVCPALYFRPHYFILALPAISLMAGAAVVAAGRLGPAARRAAAALVALGCAQSAWASREVLFQLAPAQVSRALYANNPFPEAIEVARYVAARTGPGDRIAVLGSEPEILFYANRRSATGYVYVYPLVEPQPHALRMQQEMIAELEGGAPAYVVLVGVQTSWMLTPRSERHLLEWAEGYLATNYDVVGSVAILGPEQTEYTWGDAADPGADLVVFRRKGFVSP